ncbi:MAG: DNA polymerase [Proteobacteria bacterium]|nr:DNA polymerase [Pseudomonadota bacterium]
MIGLAVTDMNPFDFVNSISYNKKDLMVGTENDELAEKGYTPFLVNKALSYYPDTIAYANEINGMHHIDNKLQYHYLLNSIRPQKRFSKWSKRQDSADLNAIKQYFNYNDRRAQEALSILSVAQINEIKEKLVEGGT